MIAPSQLYTTLCAESEIPCTIYRKAAYNSKPSPSVLDNNIQDAAYDNNKVTTSTISYSYSHCKNVCTSRTAINSSHDDKSMILIATRAKRGRSAPVTSCSILKTTNNREKICHRLLQVIIQATCS